MNLFHFIPFYLFFLAVGTLAITGWYLVTRGDKEILPDGKTKKTGNVLRGWYFYWNKEKKVKQRIYYHGEQLQKIIVEINSNYPALKLAAVEEGFTLPGSTEEIKKDFGKQLSKIEVSWDVKIIDKGFYYAIAKDYPIYIYPEWIRKPLATCSTCFAGLYGSIFYFTGISLVRENIFQWSDYPVVACIFFWLVYIHSLAVLNTAIAKKVN